MKKHFSPEKSPKNEVRYIIFQLMEHFEKADAIISKLLSFEVTEDKALDQIEDCLVKMEKLHLKMTKLVQDIEKGQTIGEGVIYESSPFYEAIRRTTNLCTALNVIDLNTKKWLSTTTRALVDPIYFRQIKSLVFKCVDEECEEN